MHVLDIRRTADSAARGGSESNNVKNLMRGIVEQVVTWVDYDVWRTSSIERV